MLRSGSLRKTAAATPSRRLTAAPADPRAYASHEATAVAMPRRYRPHDRPERQCQPDAVAVAQRDAVDGESVGVAIARRERVTLDSDHAKPESLIEAQVAGVGRGGRDGECAHAVVCACRRHALGDGAFYQRAAEALA